MRTLGGGAAAATALTFKSSAVVTTSLMAVALAPSLTTTAALPPAADPAADACMPRTHVLLIGGASCFSMLCRLRAFGALRLDTLLGYVKFLDLDLLVSSLDHLVSIIPLTNYTVSIPPLGRNLTLLGRIIFKLNFFKIKVVFFRLSFFVTLFLS